MFTHCTKGRLLIVTAAMFAGSAALAAADLGLSKLSTPKVSIPKITPPPIPIPEVPTPPFVPKPPIPTKPPLPNPTVPPFVPKPPVPTKPTPPVPPGLQELPAPFNKIVVPTGRITDYVSTKPSFDAVNAFLGGAFLYHVNGQNTPKHGNAKLGQFEAFEEAEALTVKLGRSVRLLHNPTASEFEDFGQSAEDRVWSPPKVQKNGTTKTVAGILLQHAIRGEKVSIVGHSQGNIIIRNAIVTLDWMGFKPWVRTHLKWVATGNPLNQREIPAGVMITTLNNPRDPINIIGRPENIQVTGTTKDTGINRLQHNFVLSYAYQIDNRMLWPAGNGHVPGTHPRGTTHVYDKYLKSR